MEADNPNIKEIMNKKVLEEIGTKLVAPRISGLTEKLGLKKTASLLTGKTKYTTGEHGNFHRDLEKERVDGIFTNYLDCRDRINNSNNVVFDLTSRYEMKRSFGGGKSGAYVFLVKDKLDQELKVLKLYILGLNNKIGDRDDREIFTTCTLSGIAGLPIVYDFGKTYYVDDSPFWTVFKDNFISCVDGKDEFDPVNMFNSAMYLVTSLSSGSTLDQINLFDLKPNQLLCVLYQLLIIFINIFKKLPGFVHNDLHPGNIFIDASKDFEVFMKCDDQDIYLRGPKVSIIDFDISITPEQPNNIAKSRQLFGDYLIQEAAFTLVNKILGLTATMKIIEHTKSVRSSPDRPGELNDDLRLWYVYKMLFETIIIYKFVEQAGIKTQTIPPKAAQKIVDIISRDSLCTSFDQCHRDSYLSKDSCKYMKEWDDSIRAEFKALFENRMGSEIILPDFDQLITTSIATSIDNAFGQIVGLGFVIAPKIVTNYISRERIEEIKKIFLDLENEVYDNTNQHFGLHNYIVSGGVKLRNQVPINLPILSDKKVNTILIMPKENTTLSGSMGSNGAIRVRCENLKLDVSLLRDLIKDSIKQITEGIGKKLLGPLGGIASGIFGIIGSPADTIYNQIMQNPISFDIEVDTKKGIPTFHKAPQDGLIQYLLSYPKVQSTVSDFIKKQLACDGKTTDVQMIMDKILPFVISIVKYLDDISAIDKMEVSFSDLNRSVTKQIEFNLREILESLVHIIDDVLFDVTTRTLGVNVQKLDIEPFAQKSFEYYDREKKFMDKNFGYMVDIQTIQDLVLYLTNIGHSIKYDDQAQKCKDVIEYIFSQSQERIRFYLTDIKQAYDTDRDIDPQILLNIRKIYDNSRGGSTGNTVDTLKRFAEQGIINNRDVQGLVHTYYSTIKPKMVMMDEQYSKELIESEIKCIVSTLEKLFGHVLANEINILTGKLMNGLKAYISSILDRNVCDRAQCNQLSRLISSKIQDVNNITTLISILNNYKLYIRALSEPLPSMDKMIELTIIDSNSIKFNDETKKHNDYIRFMIWVINNCINNIENIDSNLNTMINLKDDISELLSYQAEGIQLKGIATSFYKEYEGTSDAYYPVTIYSKARTSHCNMEDKNLLKEYYRYLLTITDQESAKIIIDNITKSIGAVNAVSVMQMPIYDAVNFQEGGGSQSDNYYRKYMKYKSMYLNEKRRLRESQKLK